MEKFSRSKGLSSLRLAAQREPQCKLKSPIHTLQFGKLRLLLQLRGLRDSLHPILPANLNRVYPGMGGHRCPGAIGPACLHFADAEQPMLRSHRHNLKESQFGG